MPDQPPMMTPYQAVISKRDTKLLADRPIPEATVRRILQAGRMAGSAKNVQPCRFIVLTDRGVRQRLAACGDFTAHLPDAPLAIAVVVQPGRGQWDPERATQFDAGRAAQNMMVAAWADGVTSCPNTMHRHDEAARVLGLPPDHRIAQVLLFGYPAERPEPAPRRPRLPLEDFVHRNRWGNLDAGR